MIRTSPGPTLLHGQAAFDANGDFNTGPFPLSADGVSVPPSCSPDLSLCSHPHPPSSPSAFTTSVSSHSGESDRRSKDDDPKSHTSSPRSYAPYRRPLLLSSLEQRFTEKTLRPGGDFGLSIGQVQKGKPLLRAGIKHLPNKALQEVVLMKHASREHKRFRAIASSWELKEARHYSNYLIWLHQADASEFSEAEVPDMKSLMDFKHESYTEDLLSVAITSAQLDCLEEEIDLRDGSSESPSSSSSSLPRSPSCDLIDEQ